MGKVVAVISVMPSEVLNENQFQQLKETIKKTIKPPAKLGEIEEKNVAFGLKGLNVNVSVPDSEGGVDPIAEKISGIENVESAEVSDVGRM